MRLPPEVTAAGTPDGTVLLDLTSGRYWQLNSTGSAVLQGLLDGSDPEVVAAELAARHGIDEAVAQKDVAAVVDHLRSAGLVTP
ncbi:lasso peptide biosynthesis PqqD family chaperone [Amycolatopsis sp. VS8301801F10]|uniref:lasso peptide biosynthesis PqqD family chaperone n=1 Tax=Amycolatopsis sp. VS8301801F10 TaxID=2652442 RepID=UPI0038FBF06C